MSEVGEPRVKVEPLPVRWCTMVAASTLEAGVTTPVHSRPLEPRRADLATCACGHADAGGGKDAHASMRMRKDRKSHATAGVARG